MSQILECEHGRAGPTSWLLLCSDINERDKPSPPFDPHYPLAEGRRALPEPPCRRTQESRPCTSSRQCSRADPDSMSMGEPTLSCDRDEERSPCPLPGSLPPMADRRAGPGIMSVGEQSMCLTACGTLRSRPCTSPGQQVELVLVVGVASKQVPSA